ncbi:MAG: CocE/NonD family hydrolase [Deltaproteobacteria bacterium]|nr:CocE/NonD family hydrolase [Deltaproteobacteria bacterium]
MIKRKVLLGLFLGLMVLALITPPEAFLQSGESGQPSFLPPSAPFIGRTVMITMRDGQSLAADLYLPKSSGKFPVILIQTPYNKEPMRTWWLGEGRWGANSIFTDTNYAFVVSDWRGKFASKNAQVPGRPPNLGQDGFDTIHWISQQEWSNGKIATWGLSALGRVQYETARENPPDLVCAVPMVMPLNLDYDICEGIRRMRLRHSTSREELMKPGEVYPVTIELSSTAQTFLKGHRLRLILSSSNYPKYALNLNDDGPMYRQGTGLVAKNSVYVDQRRPSALILPVVKR